MTDLRTALRRLNDAAREALRAALGSPDVYDREIVRRLRIIAADTDRMVDETAPNTNDAPEPAFLRPPAQQQETKP